MTLPTKDLTWRQKPNTAVVAQGTALATNKLTNRTAKDGLISSSGWDVAPSHLATCYYSCDSTTAGSAGDGVDRWTADSKLVWNNAGSAHSWFVFELNQIATHFQMLWSLESASATGSTITIVISPSAGFTGGTTTARPTATDEIVLSGAAFGSWCNATDGSVKLQQWISDDGKQYRQILMRSGAIQHTIMLGVPKSPVSGWTNPSWSYAKDSAALDVATLEAQALANTPIRSRIASTTANMWFTGEAASNGSTNHNLASLLTVPDAQSGEYPVFPIGLATMTGGCEGRKGVVYDLWWGLGVNSNGDTYPNDTTRTFVQFGAIVLPNNGTLLATS